MPLMEEQKEPEAGTDVPVGAIPEEAINLITELENLSYGDWAGRAGNAQPGEQEDLRRP